MGGCSNAKRSVITTAFPHCTLSLPFFQGAHSASLAHYHLPRAVLHARGMCSCMPQCRVRDSKLKWVLMHEQARPSCRTPPRQMAFVCDGVGVDLDSTVQSVDVSEVVHMCRTLVCLSGVALAPL